jgi:hypothetical protein
MRFDISNLNGRSFYHAKKTSAGICPLRWAMPLVVVKTSIAGYLAKPVRRRHSF